MLTCSLSGFHQRWATDLLEYFPVHTRSPLQISVLRDSALVASRRVATWRRARPRGDAEDADPAMAALARHARRLAVAGWRETAATLRRPPPGRCGSRPSVDGPVEGITRRRSHSVADAEIVRRHREEHDVMQSIVKVHVVCVSPNYLMPWQNNSQESKWGSGVVAHLPELPGIRDAGGLGVLTNAHVVADQTFVQVQRHGSTVKYKARVYAVGHDCDLAILTVNDPDFFSASPAVTAKSAPEKDPYELRAALGAVEADEEAALAEARVNQPVPCRRIRPPTLGDVPNLQERVSVMGFPWGGDNLSVTNGVVSRVELTNYAHGATELLSIQLDAAINQGNSGGPAVQGGRVIGLAFQTQKDAESIGYVIPTPIIRRFIEDIAEDASAPTTRRGALHFPDLLGIRGEAKRRGLTRSDADEDIHYPAHMHRGFCTLGIKCQATESTSLRSYLGMRPHETGVLVLYVAKTGPSAELLRVNDVLMEVDGEPVSNDGTIVFRGWERVAFDHLLALKRPGQTVDLKVRRRCLPENEQHGTVTGEESTEGSEVVMVKVAVQPHVDLCPVQLYDRPPSYYVFAGLVFVPLSQPALMDVWGENWYNDAPR